MNRHISYTRVKLNSDLKVLKQINKFDRKKLPALFDEENFEVKYNNKGNADAKQKIIETAVKLVKEMKKNDVCTTDDLQTP